MAYNGEKSQSEPGSELAGLWTQVNCVHGKHDMNMVTILPWFPPDKKHILS